MRGAGRSASGAPQRRREGCSPGSALPYLPYLLILPAILLELLIHVVPMVIGIWMSFLKLTQFYLRNWSAAPLGLPTTASPSTSTPRWRSSLLHSFLVTVVFTVLTVALSWLLGTMGAVLMQGAFRGRGLLRALFLVPLRAPRVRRGDHLGFMLQRDSGLVNHILVDQLHLADAGDRRSGSSATTASSR